MLGINESPPENTYWARWECVNRVLTIPYVSSTRIPIALFASDEEYTTRPRSIPFFFAGRTRGRVERENLGVISEMAPGSLIGVTAWDWTEDPGAYGDHISRSVFCLCPRGDTRSSRRLFDAVAAGCIPVMTRSQARPGNAPFADSLDYSGFAVLLEEDAFSTREKVATFTDALQGYDRGTILEKRHALLRAREVLVYGYSTGESFEDMLFSEGTLRALLLDVGRLATSSTLWGCEPTPWWKFPADRVAVSLPPTADDERNWAVGVSTILLREEKILVCVPPFTGSRPVRDFVKTVQKASTWEVKNFQSGHDVLRIESGDMFEVYASVGWKKTSMLRDPVTRLLSSFLLRNTSVTAADFKRFVRGLYETNVEEIPMVYRPQSSFCGMKYVHFDSLLLYEDRARSKQILESLPNDIWTKHGRNWKGTGRDVFDVESRDQYFMGLSGVTTDKCGRWTRYFDAQTLDMVASIYSEDYQAYRWYSVDLWKSRRDACVN